MGLTRLQLFRSLNVLKTKPELERATQIAYEQFEEAIWRSIPTRYATSFWASSFPVHEKSCGRQALYNLLNVPDQKPMTSQGVAVTEMGKAAEEQIVLRWGRAGYTIGGSVPIKKNASIQQLALEDSDTWLSGNLDAVLDLRPRINSVLPVDIKSKDNEAIRKMKVALLSYEPKHYAQVQAYIYLCNKFHYEMGWHEMGLEPAESGSLFYVSRENPRKSFEFHFNADWSLIELALTRLREWKEDFLFDRLPARDKSWKWTEEPCKWCEKKKYGCKLDDKEKVDILSESNIIRWAKEEAPNGKLYDLTEIKKRVFERWM